METKVKTIEVFTMYRDGANYKSHGSDTLINDTNLDFQDMTKLFERCGFHLEDPIMLQDLGLTSIAPLDNEFMPAEGDDHSFCEITDFGDAVTLSPDDATMSVSQFIKNMLGYEETHYEAARKRKDAAKIELKDHLNQLD